MPYSLLTLLAFASLSSSVPASAPGEKGYFVPFSRLPGIGAGRAELTDDIIARRARNMVESQTFAILRDPNAEAGAQRILGAQLQRLFNKASSESGVPSSLLAAMAYLESWGDPRAQSPTGPRGIMQISAGTARAMGLRVVYQTRYRVQTQTRKVRVKGKVVTRRVRVRVPYRVLVRDDRLVPERAIPAAAKYLARLSDKFGGLDWAVFAYHCGENCVASMRSLTEQARGIEPPYTVAKMFFAASPAVNRDLYLAIQYHMNRDYSPTYWFRVMRARELLEMYRKDRAEFRKLAAEYRAGMEPKQRTPHRLAVWHGGGAASRSREALYSEGDRCPARIFEDPHYYGFRIRHTAESGCLPASPSTLGALAYIAYETRRLHEAMNVRGERFVPLEVTAPAAPDASAGESTRGKEFLQSIGHVLNINYAKLPPGQREAFEFVMDELGWEGYLGFIHAEGERHTLHVGCSPQSREFFEKVFAEAVEGKTDFSNTRERASAGWFWREAA
ncbi:MAG TPA: transglycosylase SLT domain-containing protein [Bryobacteraceae bacterium]|mgnify:CR=1 FL=1|nr:transglycosylase SLT domain-containing protein [Bryobacteraceae bacterium]HOQ47604.1 transglycosylase SLT domain-containing protein [Bryobacteraceae bacterium]HPQ14754.1 transglycosylase SLT domain-containing protein [Bryobacteraceae bacterium]HPU73461.1 transglycosylase SLT domain-containing protein [Bryobacteraceae bacterium]